jgi:SIR2-like domain
LYPSPTPQKDVVSTTFDAHYARVSAAFADGQVVPLLGAGVNLCDRPADGEWQAEKLLPSGRELAQHLAKVFWYPDGEALDLLRVSQWAVAREGPGPLYDELRKLFAGDYAPTRVHRFLAALPGVLRARGTPQHQAIVTTNYDDALERAFDEAGELYDVVWYIADGEQRGAFWHRPPDGEPRLIERPKLYDGLELEERTAIVKIHGAVDRAYPERDSYVITEDHYIDYLTKTEVAQLLPAELLVRLTRSRFLFLGYSMQDWNLRVILHRIWGQQPLAYKSWAIQKGPSEMEQELWRVRGVDVLDIPLEEYVTELESRLHAAVA